MGEMDSVSGNSFNDNDNNEDDYIISIPSIFEPRKGGLGYEYYNCMQRHKEKIAQFITDSDEEDTYGSLLKRCIRTALKLREKDLDKNDIICLCTNNHTDSCVPFIASLFNGTIVCSLDPSMGLLDTTHLINQVQPKIVFVVPGAVSIIEKSLKENNLEAEIVVFEGSENCTEFAEFLEPHEEEHEFEPVVIEDLEETAVILFSSGTTGLPKGICLSHYAIMGQGINMIASGSVNSVTLYYSSLYWISGVVLLTAAILSGTARVVCPVFDPEQLWYLIENFEITFLFMGPIQAIEMLRAGRPENIDTTSLLYVLTGGASFAEKQLKDLRDLLPGTFIGQVYGQTEVAGLLTLFKLNNPKEKILSHYRPRSIGTPVPGVSYKIVNPETQEICGPNQSGELRVKTKFSMNGYYNLDSSDAFDSEGWLKTGDVVYYDDEKCFYIMDRIKEMLKYKSWHVAPAMLEQVVINHPAVKKCVVIGIPHEEDGDHPMALIILHEKFDASEEEIEKYVADRVDDRQRLRGGVKFVDNIPVTPTGKVKRKYIRSLVLSGEM